jgi:hypothetical protein
MRLPLFRLWPRSMEDSLRTAEAFGIAASVYLRRGFAQFMSFRLAGTRDAGERT